MPAPRLLRPAQGNTTAQGCVAERHGTTSAYDWWGCRCPEAREKWRLYRKRLSQGRQPPALIPAVGTARRLQALVAIGYCWKDLGRRLGVSNRRVSEIALDPQGRVHRDTAARVDALFELLSATPGNAKYALVLADRYGFVPPLAWDDNIDDPHGLPYIADEYGSDSAAVIDEVAIGRALAGEQINLSDLERHHAVHRGRERQMAPSLVAKRLHLSHTRMRQLADTPLPVYELAA